MLGNIKISHCFQPRGSNEKRRRKRYILHAIAYFTLSTSSFAEIPNMNRVVPLCIVQWDKGLTILFTIPVGLLQESRQGPCDECRGDATELGVTS